MSDINEEFNEFYLAHYGVKGMKWGRRKDRSGSGGSASRKSKRKAAAEAEILSQKKLKKMSNKQLRERINRIQMEQQYAKLTTAPDSKPKIKQGKEKVDEVLSYWNTASSVYNAVNSPLGKEIRKQLTERRNNSFSDRMGLPAGR